MKRALAGLRRNRVRRKIKAVLLDPNGRWVGNWPGPTGGFLAVLDCEHEISGRVASDGVGLLGGEVLCIECKREELNQRRRNG